MQEPVLTQACASHWRALIEQCQQALFQARDEAEFRDNLCLALVETGGYRAAWVNLGGAEQGQGAYLVAQSGTVPQACGDFPCLALPLGGSVAGMLGLCSETAFDDESRAWLALVAQGLSSGIAELRRRAETLQEMEFFNITIQRLMQQVFAVDQHAIVSVADENGIITYVNEKFCEVSQYSYDELLGQNHHIVNSGYHPRAFFADMWATIGSGKVWNGEVCNRKKNGDLYWVESTIVPSPAPSGSGYHYVSVRTDVTELKRLEGELKAANEGLEQRVLERTIELAQAREALERDVVERRKVEARLQQEQEEQRELIAKLQEAQNQLLQSEKMASIGQLAAGVAHEINNPIGYVHSNLGSLDKYIQSILGVVAAYEHAESAIADGEALSRVRAEKVRADLEFLREDVAALMAESREGITRVKKIVQDLKDFSHVDEAEWQWTDLRKGLDSTLNIVWSEIKYKAEVVKEYGELPEVECLSSQINQVFVNMLVNAAHAIEPPSASPEGKARGTITLRTGIQGDEVWVEFADTGKGIPPDNLNRIFDPFFTTKPVGQGTGLGLSLSYSIIQKHHGRIDVASEVGKGTTFRIFLPVRQPEKKA